MPGRTSDIHTSSFKPLNLNEIMMVPLAKQKMHDEILAGTDKFGRLTSDVLKQDSEKAKESLGGFKSRADQLSTDVIEKGVSRSQFQTLRGLRNETNNAMTTGFLGKAMANKKNAAEYMKDLATKKERQAGWSPKQAAQWAQAQVNAFEGTLNEDGSFNSFTGQELSSKVDEAEYIRKAIDDVAERIESTSMQLIRVGGLPEFTRAFQQGTVSSKDFNEIMRSISRQASNDPDLQAHLKQQAFFTGEKDPLDHGQFENVTRKGKDGVEYTERIWKVGTSRFGRRFAGMADAADYRNLKTNITLAQDKLGWKMHEMGMDERQATTLVNFGNGKLNNIKRATLTELRKNLITADEAVKDILDNRNKYEDKLLSENKEYMDLKAKLSKRMVNADEEKKGEEQLAALKQKITFGDKYWKELNKTYNDSAIKQSNSKAAVESVYTIANKTLSQKDKEGLALIKELETKIPGYTPGEAAANITLLEQALANIGKPVRTEQDVAELNYYDMDQDNKEAFLLSSYLEAIGHVVNKNAKADRSILTPGGSRAYDKDIVNKMIDANDTLEDKVDHILESSPKAESFTTISGQDFGKLKSPEVTDLNTMKVNNFNQGKIVLAYGGQEFTDKDAAALLEPSTKGYSYTPMFTDAWDDTGNKFDNVTVKNLEKGTTTTIQVINNNDKDMELIAARQMQKYGTLTQQRAAKRVIAGWEYMPSVKASRMHEQNTGEVFVPIQDKAGNPARVKWVRNTEYGEPYYTASINGRPLNNGQAIMGEAGMVNVIYDFVQEEQQKQIIRNGRK